jgi:hypothetical protein
MNQTPSRRAPSVHREEPPIPRDASSSPGGYDGSASSAVAVDGLVMPARASVDGRLWPLRRHRRPTHLTWSEARASWRLRVSARSPARKLPSRADSPHWNNHFRGLRNGTRGHARMDPGAQRQYVGLSAPEFSWAAGAPYRTAHGSTRAGPPYGDSQQLRVRRGAAKNNCTALIEPAQLAELDCHRRNASDRERVGNEAAHFGRDGAVDRPAELDSQLAPTRLVRPTEVVREISHNPT